MGLVKNSPMSFDQPFGLVALDWACRPGRGSKWHPAVTSDQAGVRRAGKGINRIARRRRAATAQPEGRPGSVHPPNPAP
jgi:hypothetical protein